MPAHANHNTPRGAEPRPRFDHAQDCSVRRLQLHDAAMASRPAGTSGCSRFDARAVTNQRPIRTSFYTIGYAMKLRQLSSLSTPAPLLQPSYSPLSHGSFRASVHVCIGMPATHEHCAVAASTTIYLTNPQPLTPFAVRNGSLSDIKGSSHVDA